MYYVMGAYDTLQWELKEICQNASSEKINYLCIVMSKTKKGR